MTIDEARKDQIRCECQGYRLSSLISKYDAIVRSIAELDKIRELTETQRKEVEAELAKL